MSTRAEAGANPLARRLDWPQYLLTAVLVAVAIYPLFGSDYIAHVAVIAASFALLAISLDLVIGYAGLFSIAHAAFFGIGAYVTAILTTRLGWPFWPALAAAGVLAAVSAAFMGVIFARMRGSYFAIGSFAFGELVRVVLTQWRPVTGGPMGISFVSGPEIALGPLQISFSGPHGFYVLMLIAMGLTLLLSAALLRSRLGVRMTLVRDDPELAASAGVNVLATKISALLVSGAIAGIVGGLYGAYLQFIAPNTFATHISIQLVMVVIIGGIGSIVGPILGAILVILLPQVLRIDATYSLVATGILMLVIALTLPRGLYGGLQSLWRRFFNGSS